MSTMAMIILKLMVMGRVMVDAVIGIALGSILKLGIFGLGIVIPKLGIFGFKILTLGIHILIK